MRKLTEEQKQHKQVLIILALQIFEEAGRTDLYEAYSDGDEWRLARVDDDLKKNGKGLVFHRGDITVARKSEDPGTSMPKIEAFSWRTGHNIHLKATDPIEYLED